MSQHARQRAAERFGLRLTDADIATIRADIAAGRALLSRRAKKGRGAIYCVAVQGKVIRVCLSPDGAITTVLPLRHDQHYTAPRRPRGQPKGD
jgi:hypothetical protein